MSNDVKVVEREELRTLEMQAECSMFAMPKTFCRIYTMISKYMEKSGLECVQAPYANYLEVNWDEFDKTHPFIMFFKGLFKKWKFVAGFPVDGEPKADGEIAVGVMPKAKYVEMLHKGPYQQVGKTYKAMYAYIKDNDLKIKNESIEFYMNDPSTTKAADLETVVLIPLAD